MFHDQREHAVFFARFEQDMPGLAAESLKIAGRAPSVANTVRTSPASICAKAFLVFKIGKGHLSPFRSKVCAFIFSDVPLTGLT